MEISLHLGSEINTDTLFTNRKFILFDNLFKDLLGLIIF